VSTRTEHDAGEKRGNFIRERIDADLKAGTYGGRVVTRFPPEPNGFLHIGHAKSICLNFGLARDYGGTCHLRFDDTNPTTEDTLYVEAIKRDVRWLGFDWGEHLYFASDYFEKLYEYAERLIERGLAYVCSLNEEQIREGRGSLGVPGQKSPYRARSIDENLDLFRRMRAGEFPDGAHVLRGRIDMAASNMKLRDPLLYRIRHAHHHRTGDAWCIYPMYDFAHPLSDAIERVTHSICTLEFENNRALYDWVIEAVGFEQPPVQIEFARLSLDYTVMSKRKLLRLVDDDHVSGWDDPRMPTLAGLRRRGVTPEAIRSFCDLIGVAKANSTVDIGKFEYTTRDDLNYRAPRVMAVAEPLRVVIDNYPEGASEELEAPSFPPDVGREGSRPLPFSREVFIDRDDFAESPPKGFKRLAPGRTVRLRYAYAITCNEVIKDGAGKLDRLVCSYDPTSRGGGGEGPKPSGVIHWVDAARALPAELRLYDRLFGVPAPDAEEDFRDALNPDSVSTWGGALVEPSVRGAAVGSRFQFERKGYFAVDEDSSPDRLVFNRIVSLRDSWTAPRNMDAPVAEGTPAPSAPSNGDAKPAAHGKKTRPPKRSKAEMRERARERDPQLAARYRRYKEELDLSDEDADLLTGDTTAAELFEATLAAHDRPKTVAKLMVNAALPLLRQGDGAGDDGLSAEALGEVAALIDEGTITATLAKDVLTEARKDGLSPRQIVRERGLEQIADPAALEPIVARVVAANADKAAAYRGGKTGLIGFFVGQVMKETGGKANAEVASRLLRDALR
jgi:glutaminyl-tRNA synthetase